MTTSPGVPPPPPRPGQLPVAPPAAATSAAYDGVSVSALVCALTCCAAPVAVGLGIAGLFRTSGGRRRGMWAAVTGLVLGLVETVFALAIVAAGTFWWFNVAYPGDAVPGDCLTVTRAFDGTDLWWSDCYAPHDAEVLAAGTFGPEGAERAAALSEDAWCRKALDEELLDLVKEEDLVLGLSTDAWDPLAPEAGDFWFCYAERSDHAKLYAPLLGGEVGPEAPLDA